MDPKPSYPGIWLAPPASGSSAAVRLPGATPPPRPLPLDEHLVQPETTRDELLRGRKIMAMPALPAHADMQFELGYVIGAHVKPGFLGSVELLTRAGEGSDFATDVCVRRKGTDPETGTRYLEELAFEVVSEQSLRDITEKAEDLTTRGVRRVIAIFVKKGDVCEWSATKKDWKKLDPEGTFSDRTLTRSLRVKELLVAAEADNAVARALLAKNNPVLAEAKAENLATGEKKGLRQGIEAACDLLGIKLTEERQATLDELDAAGLSGLLKHLRAERCWP